MAVRFALIEIKSVCSLMVVSENQISNRHANIGYCNILGRSQEVIILGFNNNYEVLNDIATVRNCKKLKVILTETSCSKPVTLLSVSPISEAAPVVDVRTSVEIIPPPLVSIGSCLPLPSPSHQQEGPHSTPTFKTL